MKFGQKALLSTALVGAAVAGGAVGASVLGTAQAQTDSSTTAASSPTPSSPALADHGPHTANGVTETPLTGDDLTKATEGAVDGATVERAETDAEGAAFEVHVTKADGSRATVKLDASFNVTSVEDG